MATKEQRENAARMRKALKELRKETRPIAKQQKRALARIEKKLDRAGALLGKLEAAIRRLPPAQQQEDD